MARHAVIGGTGLATLEGLDILASEAMETPYGPPSGPLVRGRLAGVEVVFLARHGPGHRIPPHRVNYRANVWALAELGIENVIAVAAVGGIARDLEPGGLVIPDQIVDYTWSRPQTFFEDDLAEVVHVDFTEPYAEPVRRALLGAGQAGGVPVRDGGTYGATQGPRLETAAEVDRLERDGCHVVGMTGMPEAALARERSLRYGAVAVVANHAAGRGEGEITMAAIERNLKTGMARVRRLLQHAIPLLQAG